MIRHWPVFTSTVTAKPAEPNGTVLLPALMLCCLRVTLSGNTKPTLSISTASVEMSLMMPSITRFLVNSKRSSFSSAVCPTSTKLMSLNIVDFCVLNRQIIGFYIISAKINFARHYELRHKLIGRNVKSGGILISKQKQINNLINTCYLFGRNQQLNRRLQGKRISSALNGAMALAKRCSTCSPLLVPVTLPKTARYCAKWLLLNSFSNIIDFGHVMRADTWS